MNGKHDLTRIADFARTLGWHGVLIMSPVCPTCGCCHKFEMSSDLGVEEDGEKSYDVSQILLDFAAIALQEPSSIEGVELQQ
jgi:hypothetical protein